MTVSGTYNFGMDSTEVDHTLNQENLRDLDERDWVYECPHCCLPINDPTNCFVEDGEDDDEEEEPKEEEPEEEEEPDLVGNDSQSANNVSNTDKTKDTPNNIAFCRCGSLYLTTYKRETRCPNCYA